MNRKIEALNIQTGMIVDIYGGAERIAVEKVRVSEAVQISDNVRWRGLGVREPVTVVGYFNPEN